MRSLPQTRLLHLQQMFPSPCGVMVIGNLNAKRLTTATGLTGVGISELKTTADHRVAVI